MVYAAELAWNAVKDQEGEYQRVIKRMGSIALCAFQPTPLSIAAAEIGLTPARALLKHR